MSKPYDEWKRDAFTEFEERYPQFTDDCIDKREFTHFIIRGNK